MIIPGINEKSFEEIKNKIALMEGDARIVQIDVEDGKAVDGLTYLNIGDLNQLDTKIKFDIDLMVEKPLKFLEVKILNAIKISLLADTEENISPFIKKAKTLGYQVGLSVRPSTKNTILEKYIDQLDYVQFFTIKPGGSGREFQINVLEKIQDFRANHPTFPIQVDGGIDADYLKLVLKAGVNDVIMTSKIFWAPNPRQALLEYTDIAKEYY
jgi:ribulose-phosphate 3-epimerase